MPYAMRSETHLRKALEFATALLRIMNISRCLALLCKNRLSISSYSLWHFVPTIGFVRIVCSSPFLTAEGTNNTSGLKLNRFSLIAGTRSEPPTAIEGEVRLEESQMFVQMLLGFFDGCE